MEKRIPDLYMEQQLLGELPPEKELEIKNNEETDFRIESLENSNREILERYPADRMADLLKARIEKEEPEANLHNFREALEQPDDHRRSRKIWRSVPLLAAAALAAFIILPATLSRENGSPFQGNSAESLNSGVRIKGLDPHLNIYRKSGDEVELLPQASKVNNFDLLQISYISGGKKYGTIFSIDGNGFVTLHYPDFTGASPELFGEGEVPLDFSYQLDDAPGFERFFFITSDSYFSVNTVLESASRLAGSYYQAREGELDVPDVCETESILLLKEGSDE